VSAAHQQRGGDWLIAPTNAAYLHVLVPRGVMLALKNDGMGTS